jgi:hypothetical protein
VFSSSRALAEIAGHQGRPDRNRRDQQRTAEDQPSDRAAAENGCDLERSGTD